MQWDLNFRTKKRANLVFKDHVIRLIDSRQPGLSSVRAFAQRFLPEGVIHEGRIVDRESLQIILEECVEEWGIKRRQVQFLAPDPFVIVRKMQIPVDIKDEEIKGYFYMEFGSSIHLPFEDPAFDVEILGIKNNKKEVLFIAAPESIVLEYAGLLEAVKLKPTAVDISPLALYRLYYASGLARPEDHLLCIEFDIQTVNLSIFFEHKIVFMRSLRMNTDLGGWEKVRDESGAESLRWSGNPDFLLGEMDNMLTEIDRVMNFYHFSLHQGKHSITKALLTGDHPYLDQMKERLLETIVEIPVETLAEQRYVTIKGEQIPPVFYLPLGLSLKEV